MPEDAYNFAQTRLRLEEIVSQVRKKDVSLEKSLDLLEEGVRLANQCTELIDHADWDAASGPDPASHADVESDEATATGERESAEDAEGGPSSS